MRIFHSPPFIQEFEPSVATIGNFDGMHLGHQSLLQQVIACAKEKKLKSTVILFEPHPLEFLQPNNRPARLQTLSDKLFFLQKIGIDQVIVIRFTQKFSQLSPEQFVEEWLLKQFAVRALFVGTDFCFGHKRSGNMLLLKKYETQGLLTIFSMPLLKQDQTYVRSTEIRQQLQMGNFNEAAQLLGRPFVMTGRVMHGAKIGRLIRFPTINLALRRHVSPLHGIYAVRVWVDAKMFLGVASIGVRPTVSQSGKWLLEVFLFTKENVDLYARRVSVEFVAKVRNEEHFDSLAALQAQIEKDVAWVRGYFQGSHI